MRVCYDPTNKSGMSDCVGSVVLTFVETLKRARDLDPDEAIKLIEIRLRDLRKRWSAEVSSVAANAIYRIGSLEEHARQAYVEYRRTLARVEQEKNSELSELSARLSDLGVTEPGIEAVLRNLDQLTTAREDRPSIQDEMDPARQGVARLTPRDVIEWTLAATAGGIIGNLSTDALKVAWRQGRSRIFWFSFGGTTARDEVDPSFLDGVLNLLAIYAVVVRCRELNLAFPGVSDLKVSQTSTTQSGYLVVIEWQARPGFSAQVRIPFEDLRPNGVDVFVTMPRES
jgi:hypothetical protein